MVLEFWEKKFLVHWLKTFYSPVTKQGWWDEGTQAFFLSWSFFLRYSNFYNFFPFRIFQIQKDKWKSINL